MVEVRLPAMTGMRPSPKTQVRLWGNAKNVRGARAVDVPLAAVEAEAASDICFGDE